MVPHRKNVKVLQYRILLLVLAAGTMPAPLLLGQGQDRRADDATAVVQGVVRDSNQKPVSDATICLHAKNGPDITAYTNAAGAYRLSQLAKGIYALQASKPGYLDQTLDPVVLGSAESRTLDLILHPAKTSASLSSSPLRPEFFEEPSFTVAGVTDTSTLGGHGSSNIMLHSQETLATETDALRKLSSAEHSEPAAAEHHSLAEQAEKQGNPLDAVREYQRAAELEPSESNLFDWGSYLLLHRAAEPAVEVFKKGNRLFPKSVRMLAGLGAAWFALGSYDNAVQLMCEASDLNPADPEPYLFMGTMQSAKSIEPDAMAARFERFARSQPENALANYYYAVSIWKRRSSSEDVEPSAQAKTLLEKAIRLDPNLAPAELQLGILASEQKDFPQAIASYQRALQIDPLFELAHYRLAQAYRRSGESAKAAEEMHLFEQISRKKADESERQRRAQQRFIYQLRDPQAAQPK